MAGSMPLSLSGVLVQTFHTLRKDFFDPYRPDLHYMRGPGPKWREKHDANALAEPSTHGISRKSGDVRAYARRLVRV